MIHNERQYRITKAQADKFEQSLMRLTRPSEPCSGLHPLLQKAQEDALRSQLADLQAQLQEYEALRSGKRRVLSVPSLEELPQALIQARIASGLSQKELATRLGLKEQQIQRYEATEYASVSLNRLRKVVKALGVGVRVEVRCPDSSVKS